MIDKEIWQKHPLAFKLIPLITCACTLVFCAWAGLKAWSLLPTIGVWYGTILTIEIYYKTFPNKE
jgi:hypothetical protein